MVSEYRMLRRDGEVVWVRDEARLVAATGQPPRWRGVLIDITEARLAQQALAESHERYRGLVLSLPVCAYEADPAAPHRREFVSPQLHELVGYTPAEWEADPAVWERTVHPHDRGRVLADEERLVRMAVGTPWVSEYRLVHRDGRTIWVRDRAVVAEGTDGRHKIDGILTDITSVKEGGAEGEAADVLRISCRTCGASHAAERAGSCPECGSGDVETTSLNEVLEALAAERRRVEALLDGVHQHLESVSGGPERVMEGVRTATAERRIVTRLSRNA